MHKLFAKQLAQATGPSGQVDVALLGQLVSAAFEEGDEARGRAERSLALMTEERDRLNQDLDKAIAESARRLQQREAELISREMALRERNRQLDVAVNNMTQGLVMFSADVGLVLWNRRYLEMYGLSPDVVKEGCSSLDLIKHRQETGTFYGDPETYVELMQERLANGEVHSQDLNLTDGRSFNTVVWPLPGGGWVSTHEEITARRRVELSLREQKKLTDTAVDNMAQGLVMFDANAQVILWNQRYLDIYDLPSGVIREGCIFLELMLHRSEAGLFTGDPEEISRKNRERVLLGQAWTVIHELRDGRYVQAIQRPLPEGGWVSTHEDITERVLAQREIEHLAHHDILTGLPNRALFSQFLSRALDEAAQHGTKVALLSIDLDRLKEVNDVFGHAAGDILLKRASERLKRVADGAFVARLGGDEFSIVVTEGQLPATAEDLAKKLHVAMSDEIQIDQQPILSGLSIGIAMYPSDGSVTTTLLANGDAALYRAKREGRGRTCFFDAEMDEKLRERHALQHDLRQAIRSDSLTLVYQPQSRINGEIVGFEVLARWHHPFRGLIDPDVFIPLAEENGLIIPLGERVLRDACAEASSWRENLRIAVNLSPMQFKRGDLPRVIHTILLETGLAPHRLELEITEGVLIDDFSRATSILRQLRALGVKIAMDDFGTGYSSLSYLHSVPLDKIKIDRSFIAQIDKNPQSAAIIRAVIGLAHGVSLPVLAEGIESKEQLEFLREESCDEVQGFFIGRPKDIESYAAIVGKSSGRGQERQAPAV